MALNWIKDLKTVLFTEYPSFTFIVSLVILEKLLEIEFLCPCNGNYLNSLLTSFIFLFPAALLFVLTLKTSETCTIQCKICKTCPIKCGSKCETSSSKCCNTIKTFIIEHCTIQSFYLPFAWAIVLLYDGRYVSCACTDWKGLYVFMDNSNQKWCEPRPEDGYNSTELRLKTQEYFAYSQIASLGCLSVVILVLSIYKMSHCTCSEKQNSQSDPADATPTTIPLMPQ